MKRNPLTVVARAVVLSAFVVLLVIVTTMCTTISGNGNRDGMTVSSTEIVRVNQVGYLPDDDKFAVVVADAQGESIDNFALVDFRTDEVVFQGSLEDPIDDANSGDQIRIARFSDVEGPGRFVIELEDGSRSPWFDIRSDVYHHALFSTLRSYTLQRSITDIHDPVSGLEREGGHEQDAEARLFFSDEYYDEGDTLDVRGGWYDAGDFGMYMPPSNVTVAQLLLAYEWSPDLFYEGQFAFPDTISRTMAGAPDILEEVRFNLEWMLRMQRPDGAVYHKNSGLRWPADGTLPAQDGQTRYVFGMSTFGTAGFAGATAMASRIYREYDEAFADELLEAAVAAFDYLEANPEPSFRFDEGQDQGSGPYDKETDLEERLWAAAELLRTTDDKRYEAYILDHDELAELLEEPTRDASWLDALILGQWAYINSESAEESRRDLAREAILDGAQELYEHVVDDGYNVALTADDYTWSSAKVTVARGNVLLKANAIEENADYEQAALDQLHYILGRNTNAYSYLTGVGQRTPANVHHRVMAGTGTQIPGLLVGGPNIHGGDPTLDSFIDKEAPPPGRAYLDHHDSWASNEYAIDYTAPVVFALAHFLSPSRDQVVLDDPPADAEPAEPLVLGVVEELLDEERLGTFSDPASTIDYTIAGDILVMDYYLNPGGWLGVVVAIQKSIEDIEGFRLEYRGTGSGKSFRFEIQDAEQVHFEYMFEDDSDQWQSLEVALEEFSIRGDYQPAGVNPAPDHTFNRALIDNFTFSPLGSGEDQLEIRALEVY